MALMKHPLWKSACFECPCPCVWSRKIPQHHCGPIFQMAGQSELLYPFMGYHKVLCHDLPVIFLLHSPPLPLKWPLPWSCPPMFIRCFPSSPDISTFVFLLTLKFARCSAVVHFSVLDSVHFEVPVKNSYCSLFSFHSKKCIFLVSHIFGTPHPKRLPSIRR